jgi:Zn ribbon nucleic-acid-binding protein
MPRDTASHRQAVKARGTIAKKVGKDPRTFERYWKAGKEQAGIGEAKKPRDPYAYAMAIAMRRAQGTGSKPHKKVSEESFDKHLGNALSVLGETGLKCPKCSSNDTLAGTKTMKHHCSSCGHNWGEGEKPEKMKEDATTTAGVPDVAFAGGKGKKKKDRGTRYMKKDMKQLNSFEEDVEEIADTLDVDESYNDNYLRPQTRDLRAKQADGSSPPLEDDVISEYPDEDDEYGDAVDASTPEGQDSPDKVDYLRKTAQERGIKTRGELMALAQELFAPREDTIMKDPEILGTITQ